MGENSWAICTTSISSGFIPPLQELHARSPTQIRASISRSRRSLLITAGPATLEEWSLTWPASQLTPTVRFRDLDVFFGFHRRVRRAIGNI